ncbi:3-ketoacyl-ACP reductase [Formosa algae]|uniref:3-oxoacyl-[acyl-carrier protein] reductase n=1 Tax=Formosa algae TaxID=225843 RepID=A0A9X1CD31_9FLAO|nr:3-ketoacyl-ACP reductase [Formosa algae]MBP1840905.1 3-oxoacyl-[acyl-carrier protein] reductase [Formosa algae]MDQ0336198.1 3-oxoacyl-[acyl-carrier protein] reductase [Formosa algae]OEI79972.1 3-ketoacyl-ACP reductase [Formosa algae]PNW28313.1 3-ketoacyl-ACP reductase [Formosa algae]
MKSLKGQHALITGAGKGLGKAMALALAEEGVHIALLARTTKDIEAVAEEVKALGVEAITVTADVSSIDEVNAAAKTVLSQFKSIDILINNAGIAKFGSFMELEVSEWEQIINVNVMGMYYVTRAFLPQMIDNKFGDIINVSSTAGLNGNAMTSAYSTSKFAVLGLSESLMKEVRKHNIRVTAITPSTIATDMAVDLKLTDGNPETVMQAEDFAELVVSQLKLNRRVFIKESSIWSTNP